MELKKKLKTIVKKFLGIQENAKASYSQEGEDVLLARIIGHIHYPGSFLDIGAHHPTKFSNTYKFYEAGWRGINIEATPGSSVLFNQVRPGDINLEVPISDKEEELVFYVFNYPELNTFSLKQAKEWDGKDDKKVIDKIKLQTKTISKILEQYSPNKTHFDLLSIDVEGLDLQILETLDFSKYKFNYILAEDEPGKIENAIHGQMTSFLFSKGYKLMSKLYYSNLYVWNGK